MCLRYRDIGCVNVGEWRVVIFTLQPPTPGKPTDTLRIGDRVSKLTILKELLSWLKAAGATVLYTGCSMGDSTEEDKCDIYIYV